MNSTISLKSHFKVAIVGRPNVGKSSIFNRLVGKRRAIVDAYSGVTRDRIMEQIKIKGKVLELIDTGGIFEGAQTTLEEGLLGQAKEAIKEADITLFVTDAIMGLHPMDKEILYKVLNPNKTNILVVNKADNPDMEISANEFSELGLDSLYPVSAMHGKGFRNLEKEIINHIPDTLDDLDEIPFKLTLIGKPNVGKSSIINSLLGQNRVIVSEIPGTTRDVIHTSFEYLNQPFCLVDTAGLTRRARHKIPVDAYSVMRCKEAISQSDMALFIIDCDKDIEQQDRRISKEIHDAGKCCFVIVNKWDLVKNVRQEHYARYINENLPWLGRPPILFTSVTQNLNIDKILDLAINLRANSFKRVPTSLLNQHLLKIHAKTPPPLVRGKRLKIYYVTQTSEAPPTFVLFVNQATLRIEHYISYLRNQIRLAFGFEGMPIRIHLRTKKPTSTFTFSKGQAS